MPSHQLMRNPTYAVAKDIGEPLHKSGEIGIGNIQKKDESDTT